MSKALSGNFETIAQTSNHGIFVSDHPETNNCVSVSQYSCLKWLLNPLGRCTTYLAKLEHRVPNMTSATFFPTRWPTSTYGPGLHNHEIHAEQSACARGWSAARTALHLCTLYRHLPSEAADFQCFLHYAGNIYYLGRGVPLQCFLDSLEAKYREVTVFTTSIDEFMGVDMATVTGQCAEELVPGSKNRGLGTQFAWAFRWMAVKCNQWRIGHEYQSLLQELD